MRSDTQAGKGVAGKTAGSRTYAQMDTRGVIQDRASITPYNKFTGRHGTIVAMRWRSYREQHRAASADTKIGFVRYGTITSVMYALGTTFSAIRKFSIIPIKIASASAYLSGKNRTARFVFTFEFFRQIHGVEIATVRPHLVANRESLTDRTAGHRTAARSRCTSRNK